MNFNVILKSKASFLDTMFTYSFPSQIAPGTRVLVPFGNGNVKTIGIVMDESRETLDYELKEIIEILDNKPIISKEMIELVFFMVKNNISDYSSAISTILPPGSIDKVTEYFQSIQDKDLDLELKEFLFAPKSFEEIKERFGSRYKVSEINDFVKNELIESFFDISQKSSLKYDEFVEIIDKDALSKIRKNANSQRKILEYLIINNRSEKRELLSKTETSLSSLNQLVKSNLVKIEKVEIYRDVLSNIKKYDSHQLNQEQMKVFEEISNGNKETFLIHGVTGSGKTEVYLQLVQKCLEENKESIILVPEISLTPQTIDRFQGRFGSNIAVLHSKLSVSERADQWRLIKNKKVKIVVGARSAIFAPFENLGLIVIDEEHESSYRSDKNPKYSAIEIARERLKYHGANLVLGSATPSIKTMYEVYKKEVKLLQLKNRVNNIQLPSVDIVDMRVELKNNNFSMFSKQLKDKINDAISKKEQVILFLNKRGHSSFVFCRSCGYVHKCEACDVAMTYHKSQERLICHYCGRTAIKPTKCKNCGGRWIKEYGAGTQMLEEQARLEFPNLRIFRMDADTVSNRADYEKVYTQMKDGEIDLLIGTQMLAKGLDFPNVSVVGIVSADISLNIPDFRASEKTFGLVTQVSGRAGRGHTDGNVVIQTYNPNNFALKFASDNDYFSFYNQEMNNRKAFNYPPFVNILVVNISCLDRSHGIKVGQRMMIHAAKVLREQNENLVEMTGPTPSVIEKVNNRYRFDLIFKSENKNLLLDIANSLRTRKRDNSVYINYRLEEE